MPSCCKNCVLHPDHKKRIHLREKKFVEIQEEALSGTNQICHNSPEGENKICRGVRDYQIMIFHRLGYINEETEESLLEKMEQMLKTVKV